MKKQILFTGILSATLTISGCKTFEKVGNSLGSGLNKQTRTMGRNLVAGVQEGVSDANFRQDLQLVLDSLIDGAGLSANRTITALRDSVLSDRWLSFSRQLVEELSGQHTRSNLAMLREEVVGDTTRQRVNLLVSEALNQVLNERTTARLGLMRDELLGTRTQEQLAALRSELLGPTTNKAIQTIVDTAMMTIAFRLKHDVKDAVGENASFLQRWAGKLLVMVGVIAAVIILLVWRNRQKYLKLVTLLTSQIHAIPDERAYNDLTLRIKQSAVNSGVEPTLRKVLSENGLAGEQARQSLIGKRAQSAV